MCTLGAVVGVRDVCVTPALSVFFLLCPFSSRCVSWCFFALYTVFCFLALVSYICFFRQPFAYAPLRFGDLLFKASTVSSDYSSITSFIASATPWSYSVNACASFAAILSIFAMSATVYRLFLLYTALSCRLPLGKSCILSIASRCT